MKQTILYILIIVFFTGCIIESKKKISNPEQNKFIGNWESLKRIYPYKSFLIIKSDSTFHFEYGACLASGFSNGKWKMNDSTIILNSLKTDSCMYITHFGDECTIISESDTSKYIIEKTIPDCNPPAPTKYVEFNNEEFYIDNDTLKYRIKNVKRCPEIRNDFLKIIKDTFQIKS